MKNVISELIRRGHSVKYFKRKDGGYRILNIDGVTYTGSKGNAVARAMVGATLSERRTRQLEHIRKTHKKAWKEGGFGYKKTIRHPLPEDIEKMLKRTQRKYRKSLGKGGMTITRKNVVYTFENYGYAEAMRTLRESYKYASGIAYEENVIHLIDSIRTIESFSDYPDEWEKLADYIYSIIDTFKEEWIWPMYEEVIYPASKPIYDHRDLIAKAYRTMK